MAAYQFANNAVTTLDGAIDDDDSSLTVDDASAFPSSGDFTIIVESEIMLVTGVSSNTFTISRGQESTAAASHANGVGVRHILTADFLNDLVSDMHDFRVDYRNSNQSLTTATDTTIIWDQIETAFAVAGISRSSGVYTVTSPGRYRITAQITFDANSSGRRAVLIQKNGTTTIGHQRGQPVASPAAHQLQVVSKVVDFASSDTFQVIAQQSSGGALNVTGGVGETWICIERIGA